MVRRRRGTHFVQEKAEENKKSPSCKLVDVFNVHRNFIIVIQIDEAKANGMSCCMCACG